MNCPDCGGPMWDNRQTKKKPTQPDFKCKDKDGCGKGVWLQPKGGGDAPDTTTNGKGNGVAPRASRPLGALYYQCMKVAQATVAAHIGESASASDVIAATATLFIAAANTGVPVIEPKKKPAPPAPKPPPPPEPEPTYEDEDDLPF